MENVIIIGGGGVGGAFSLGVISRLKRRHHHRWIGTSIGAFIAAAMALGRRPADVLQTFRAISQVIFAERERTFPGEDAIPGYITWRRVIASLFGPMYDGALLSTLMRDYFGAAVVSEHPNLGVVCYDVTQQRSVVVTDGTVADAVTASCSAPSFFPPQAHLLDGGLAANLAVALAKYRWPWVESALTIPSGGLYKFDLSDWNPLKAIDVITAMMAGQVHAAEDLAASIYPRHLNIDCDLAFGLDDASLIDELYKRGVDRATSFHLQKWESDILPTRTYDHGIDGPEKGGHRVNGPRGRTTRKGE